MVGFRSGFCGSVTTFSSWMDATATSFAAGTVDWGLLQLFAGLSIPFESLKLGAHFGEWLTTHARIRLSACEILASGHYRRVRWYTPADAVIETYEPRQHWYTSVAASFCIAILFPVLILIAMMLIFENVAVPLSILVSPVGTNFRVWPSRWNKYFPNFPLFTFLVNVLGTLALAGVYVYRTRSNSSTEMVVVPVLADGFCGAWTTLSTLTNELNRLAPFYAIVYATASIVVALALSLAVKLGTA